jgi:DNA-binding beta-propeller fold protein YncE
MVSSGRSRRLKALLVLSLLLSVVQRAHATPSWMFGGLVQTLYTGGSITLNSPSAMVVDPAGDVFVADTGNHQIVEVNAYGTASVLTISGLSPALVSPTGIAIDGLGNLYITDADVSNSRVVKVSSSGAGSVISTGAVVLASPKGVALDQAGDIFIADTGNNRIVEVTSAGSASVFAISGLTSPATLNTPMGLAVDTAGNLYIADSVNNRVVKVASGGTAGTLVSTGELDPALNAPSGVAVDRIGNIYIASTGSNNIAEVDTSGTGTWLFFSSLYMETFSLSGPLGVALDVFGTVYVADSGAGAGHDRVLIVDRATDWPSYSSSLNGSAVGFGHVQLGALTGVTLTLPFVPGINFSTTTPFKVFTSGVQNLDFTVVTGENTNCSSTSDYLGCTIEVQFVPTAPGLRDGAVVLYDENNSPIITVPLYGFGDASLAVLAPNTGTVVSTGGVALNFPFQIALDGAGNIYDANDGGNVVKIPAGGGTASVVSPSGYTFGQEVDGVALDGAGNLYISDHLNNRIIVITPGGVASVLTISGLATALGHPTGLAFDAAGNLYISDYSNGRVVEVSCLLVAGSTSRGIGTVIATRGYTTTSLGITGVAVDSKGNIYIPDGYAADPSRVIKVTAAGATSLLTPTGITFSRPEGVTADGMDNLYIADGGNNRIVEITTAGVASVLAFGSLPTPTTLGSPFGITVDPFGNLYIPDSGNGRILFSNVLGSALTFPSTATGATSAAKTETVTNLGNQPLVFSTNPTYTANFSNYSSDQNPCTSSTSLLAGTRCDVSVVFTPQSVGSLSAGITLTDNTLNVPGSTQQVAVSGTAFSGADATSTTVTVAPTSLANGQAASITATVADQAHSGTHPTGSVSFTDTLGTTTTTLSSASLSSGAATLSGVVLSGVGTHTLSANYAGVSGAFAASSGTVTVVLSKAAVTVSGPTLPVAVTFGQSGSVTITVTGPYSTIAAPTGTISYSILNSSATGVASGTPALTAGSTSSSATIPIPNTLASGSYTIHVTYGGDGNYGVTSTATTIQLSVGQITPTIGWNPGTTAITYRATLGGILDASALNGTTAVPGTFTYTATLSGGAAAAVTSASVLGAGSYTLTATFTPTDTTTYKTVSATATLTVNQASQAISFTPPASPVTYGVSPITLAASGGSSGGAVTFSVTGPATLSGNTLTITGAGTVTVTASQAGNTNYTAATSVTATLTVNQASQTISFTPPASPVTYGVSPITLAASGGSSGNAVTFSVTGPATLSGSTLTITGAGTVEVTASQAGNTNYTAATSVTQTIVITHASASVSLVASANPILVTNAVTFTATVASGAGTPTGSVSFIDGTTLLGAVALSSGVASYTTSSLSAATHSITAVYSGNSNSVSVTSSALAELVQDYSLSISGSPGSGGGGNSQTVAPGGTATYTLALGPSNGATFPAPVTLSLSGLPPGATGSITPNILPAGSSLTNVTLSIQLPQVTARFDKKQAPNRHIPPVFWGLLLLPLAGGMRRAGKRFGRAISVLMLVVAGLTVMATLNGCGSSNGFFGQQQKTYVVTVIATSGALSHSANVTLTVE